MEVCRTNIREGVFGERGRVGRVLGGALGPTRVHALELCAKFGVSQVDETDEEFVLANRTAPYDLEGN